MPSSESCQRRTIAKVSHKSSEREGQGRTHHIVDAAGVDLESRVRLGDASQTGLGTKNREDLDLRNLETPVELCEAEGQFSKSAPRRAVPILRWTHEDRDGGDGRPAGGNQRIQEVQRLDRRRRRQFLILAVTLGGQHRCDSEGTRVWSTHVFDGLERDFFSEQAEVEHARFREQVEDGLGVQGRVSPARRK